MLLQVPMTFIEYILNAFCYSERESNLFYRYIMVRVSISLPHGPCGSCLWKWEEQMEREKLFIILCPSNPSFLYSLCRDASCGWVTMETVQASRGSGKGGTGSLTSQLLRGLGLWTNLNRSPFKCWPNRFCGGDTVNMVVITRQLGPIEVCIMQSEWQRTSWKTKTMNIAT